MRTGRRAARGVAAAAAALAITGCSWRLETPDPSPLSPDAYQTAREDAAEAEARVVDAVALARPSGPGGAWLAVFEQDAAPAHLAALGGVYDPFPSTTPSPSPGDAGLGPTSLSRLASFARDQELLDALEVEDPDLALLLGSSGLSHAVALAVAAFLDAKEAGAEAELVAERTPPVPGFDVLVPESSSLPSDTLEGIVVAHDYASYLYEVIAARSSGTVKNRALARSRIHAKRADDLVEVLGSDPRQPGYQIPRDRLKGREARDALARETELDIADRYVVAFAEAASLGSGAEGDRGWLLAAAFDALTQELLWSGATVADAETLPGVVLGDAAG